MTCLVFNTAPLVPATHLFPILPFFFNSLDYPSWFFPQHFSYAARSLLSGLLHPDASCRLSVRQVGLLVCLQSRQAGSRGADDRCLGGLVCSFFWEGR